MEYRTYLVNPELFSDDVSFALSQVPHNKIDFRRIVKRGHVSIPDMMAQCLVVAQLLHIDLAQELALELNVTIPSWCTEKLITALKTKPRLRTDLERLLDNMYSVKHLPFDTNESNISLFYESQMQLAAHWRQPLPPHDRIWTRRLRDEWVRDISSYFERSGTFPTDYPNTPDDVFQDWLQQQSFYTLKRILCTLPRESPPALSQHSLLKKAEKGARANFPPAVPFLQTLRRSKFQSSGFEQDFRELARYLNPVLVGSIPLSDFNSESPYVFISADPDIDIDWHNVKRHLKSGKQIVLQGKHGVVDILFSKQDRVEWTRKQCAFLRGLEVLGVSHIQWRDFDNRVHQDSPRHIANALCSD
jgi:hypothetical protein